MTDKYLLEDEPTSYKDNRDALDKLLWHFVEHDGDDLMLMDGVIIKMSIHGRLHPVSKRVLTHDDVKSISAMLYKSENAYVQVISGNAINDAFSINEFEKRARFRYNIVGTEYADEDACQITIRLIPTTPPAISKLGVEKEIVKNFMQQQGMVIITGPTGSGKSTLMASCVRCYLENKKTSLKIDAYESPIEFVYDELEWNNNLISQVPIPQRLPSFQDAIVQSLRRHPDIIMIGEAKDADTISKAIEASQTGHGLITTMHTNGPAETIRRMINVFPKEEKDFRKMDIIESLRMVVSQLLIPNVDGTRVAIKSWLLFDDVIRRELTTMNFDHVPNRVRDILKEKQQNFYSDAKRKLAKGLITEETLAWVKEKYGEA